MMVQAASKIGANVCSAYGVCFGAFWMHKIHHRNSKQHDAFANAFMCTAHCGGVSRKRAK